MNYFGTTLTVLAGMFVLAAATTKSAETLAATPAKPAACSTQQYHQFDFWVGDWQVRDPKGELAGTNDVTKIQGGCVLQEHWVDTQGMTGTSLNVYNARSKQWHQTWVDNQGGLLVLDGGLVDGAMVLTGHNLSRAGKPVVDRITWSKMSNGNVRQVWDRSADDGKTWTTVFDGIYSPKTS
jgi:hypothetical protein